MADESATSTTGRNDEVWLRGNTRPVALVAAGGLILSLLAVGLAWWGAGIGWARAVGVVAAILIAPSVVVLAVVASRPRLRRLRDVLEVRLSPVGVQRVPLEVVECVFPGSRSLPPRLGAAAGQPPDRRVTTVIIRLAERAKEWRDRPTYAPWGSWEDGHIVIDGRWSEPLSPERTRLLATRLIEARNGRAGDCGGGPDA